MMYLFGDGQLGHCRLGANTPTLDLCITRNMNNNKEYKFCQSCGYPMSKDKQGGGTEKDGTINKKYCSMCYANGRFLTPPDVDTAEKMQAFCIDAMRKDGMNRVFAWLATRSIPRLERWKKKP